MAITNLLLALLIFAFSLGAGQTTPTTSTSCTNGQWTNCRNAMASDNAYASRKTVGIGFGNHYQYGYDFTIPNATVWGVILSVEESMICTWATSGIDHWISIDGGTTKNSDKKGTTTTTTDTVYTLGDSGDLWGLDGTEMLTTNIVNSDSFAIIFEFRACIVEGGNILMSDGTTKKIENIRIGDKVMSASGEAKVTDIYPAYKYSYLVFNDKLRVTDTHPIFIEGREKPVEAKNLKIGDYLIHPDGKTYEEITSVKKVYAKDTRVFDISTDSGTFYADGYLVHNKPEAACNFGDTVTYLLDYHEVTVWFKDHDRMLKQKGILRGKETL